MLQSALLLAALGASTPFPDCTGGEAVQGPYGPPNFHNHTWQEKPIYSLLPAGDAPAGGWPLVVFMHGLTGQYEMYEGVLRLYASHGFAVVFPFIKGPEGDKGHFTTNTNGEYILHGLAFATNATKDPSSVLFGKVDSTRVVSAGHSMGATCSIMASKRIIDGEGPPGASSAVKLVITQHPGICGPIGPPPWPDTWMKADLKKVGAHYPVVLTTATNDAAFWPAPHTAEHELGCFLGAELNDSTAAFVQFTAAACEEDHKHDPFDDKGHDCPFKVPAPETPWVLTAMKLYAQFDGNTTTNCAALLWGDGAGSVAKDSNVNQTVRFPPKAQR